VEASAAYYLETINEAALTDLVRAAMRLNESKLKKR
jgi:hypothetical protein